VILKFQQFIVQLITLLHGMLISSTPSFVKMCDCKMSLSLVLCTQDQPLVIFHILDYVRVRDYSGPAEKFTLWEGFRALPLT
jgi:hypothetical protein